MKRNFLLLTLLFASFYSSGQMKFGLKAGTNFCFTTGLSPSYKSRVAINMGVLTQFNAGKKLLIQPELLYSIKGFRFPATTANGEGFTNMNYISLPIMAGYRITDKLNILAGPEFNFLTKAVSRFDGKKQDITDNFNKFELGAGVGITYTEIKGFGLELRYSYGISNLANVIVTDQNGNEVSRGGTGHNQTLQFGILYIFNYR